MSRLTIAIPSKGRLKDNAEAWLGRAGFKLRQSGGDRGYTAELKGLPGADVLLLSAREIAQGLIEGVSSVMDEIVGSDPTAYPSETPSPSDSVLHSVSKQVSDLHGRDFSRLRAV